MSAVVGAAWAAPVAEWAMAFPLIVVAETNTRRFKF